MVSFLIGLQFLTRINLVRQDEWTQQGFGASVKFFPAVGAVVGAICAAVVFLLQLTGLPLLTGAVAFALPIILTGGIHCDGLADSADGLLSGREREKILVIMKDSRTGSFGVTALLLTALLEGAALVELARLSAEILCAAVYASPIIARLMMVVTIGAFPYARPDGMGKAFAMFTTRRTIFFAAAETFLLLVPLMFGGKIFLCAAFATATALLMTWRLAKFSTEKIGGVTGDIYGAVTMLAELVATVTFLLTANAMR
ncbi:MAG: adenosylcobinamide-GDP ribazoletransferase [Quinella sp. 2Q5]|nr:adenosylcobinamide-GDP ribazoletransferase [Quinella sp. 2Q5]